MLQLVAGRVKVQRVVEPAAIVTEPVGVPENSGVIVVEKLTADSAP